MAILDSRGGCGLLPLRVSVTAVEGPETECHLLPVPPWELAHLTLLLPKALGTAPTSVKVTATAKGPATRFCLQAPSTAPTFLEAQASLPITLSY